MSDILIEANNISKIYDQDIFFKRGTNFRALNMVDLVLYERDFITIMGPSGSGKSTLLNCLSTLDQVTTGSIKVLGDLVNDLNDFKLSTFRYKYLGFVFQNHNLISTLSIFDNIATPIMLANIPPNEIIDRVRDTAKKLNILHILNRKPEECSGGEKQRAAIARAIINNPKIIICDEPTGNLDSKNSHEVLKLLCQLNSEGASIILVTHDNMIASYAKSLIYLHDGNIKTVLYRNNSSQIEFFREIVKITTEDSLLKLFNSDESVDNLPFIGEEDVISHEIKVKKMNISHDDKKIRESVYVVFPNSNISLEAKKCKQFYVYDDHIEYNNIFHEDVVIDFKKINKAVLSFVSIYKLLGIFSEYIYCVTMDISMGDDELQFKFENIDDLSPLFSLLNDYKIDIYDPIGIQEIYTKYPEKFDRHRYIQRNYRKFKKKYGAK